MKFLKAKWEHLLFVNYDVPPEALQPYVPKGTVIDVYEGRVFLSLVAFMFERTRVLGIRVPFHVRFEEVNLRFYVIPEGEPTKRSVTFIKEIVPRSVRFGVPLIANSLFNENYISLPMSHENGQTHHTYSWTNQVQNSLTCHRTRPLSIPPVASISEFITEHYWGYSKAKMGTLEYRVEHPQWSVCEVDDYQVSVDFAATYGSHFGFLNDIQPFSVLYAEGSDVSVSFPKWLRSQSGPKSQERDSLVR